MQWPGFVWRKFIHVFRSLYISLVQSCNNDQLATEMHKQIEKQLLELIALCHHLFDFKCNIRWRGYFIQGQTDLHMENATSAYLTARQEISILQTIDHGNIVPLLGLSLRPLALVLSLAPLGSLGNKLLQIGNDGRRLSVYAIKQIVLQVNSFGFFPIYSRSFIGGVCEICLIILDFWKVLWFIF